MGATTIDLETIRSAAHASRKRRDTRPAGTPAAGDTVQWFLDYYWIRHALSDDTLGAWRADLQDLARWLDLSRGRALPDATMEDLRDYFASRYRSGATVMRELPSVTCIRRFYAYLVISGMRADNPTETLYVRTPRLAGGALAGANGTVVR